jgi:acyl-CoA synthetase (AMP-forming)/AMP-acid ligase II
MNIVSKLRHHAETRPSDVAIIFLVDGDYQEAQVTYSELDRSARAMAGWYVERGLVGQRVLLSFPSGLEFVSALLGCLYAGVIAVPVPHVRPGDVIGEGRLAMIAQDCSASAILSTNQAVEARAGSATAISGSLPWGVAGGVLEPERCNRGSPAADDQLAFLQYTSGSTSDPKGVIVTHSNLAANFAATRWAMGIEDSTVFLGWLPLFHDMGLIGILLQALYGGNRLILLSPQHFVQKPLRWLRAISRYGANLSGGPNFAYDLCVRRINSDQRALLDLSSWRVAFNGAEPIRPSTLKEFSEVFGQSGFEARSFFPCYGLAETTLYAAGAGSKREPIVRRFDRTRLSEGLVTLVQSDSDSDSVSLVSCGNAAPEHEIAIVDPESDLRRADGEVGEICVRGPSITSGYWSKGAPRTHGLELDGGGVGFVRTGDLGAIIDGELFITGRSKDLIILRGRNIYPQDIEWISERSCPDSELGRAAAVVHSGAGGDRLAVVQELRRARGVPTQQILRRIVAAVTSGLDLSPHQIVLVPSGAIPTTSSGKTRRFAVRSALEANQLPVLDEFRAEPATEAVR